MEVCLGLRHGRELFDASQSVALHPPAFDFMNLLRQIETYRTEISGITVSAWIEVANVIGKNGFLMALGERVQHLRQFARAGIILGDIDRTGENRIEVFLDVPEYLGMFSGGRFGTYEKPVPSMFEHVSGQCRLHGVPCWYPRCPRIYSSG